MTCSAIMTRAPATLCETESVAEAAAKLISEHHPDLPVLDCDGRYVGMLGIDDLLGLVVPRVALAGNLVSNLRFLSDDPDDMRRRFGALGNRSISEFVNRTGATVAPDSPHCEVIRLLCLSRSALPVVEKSSGKVVGMVSRSDALRVLLDPDGV